MRSMILFVMLLVFCGLSAVETVSADNYLIGTYSQYQLRYVNDTSARFTELAEKLREGGFNAASFTVVDEPDVTNKLQTALEKFNNYGVRTILQDQTWLASSNLPKVGFMALTYGNYLQMEAEYELKYPGGVFLPDVLPQNDNTGNDKYNYVFRHNTGKRSEYSDSLSNKFAWICDAADTTNHRGLALSYPRFRWKPGNRTNPRTIGYDFKFRTTALYENKLYLTVAIRFSDCAPMDTVATISLKILKYSAVANNPDEEYGDYSESDYYTFNLVPVNSSQYGTTIYNQAYPLVPRDSPFGNYLFEYYINLPAETDPLYSQLFDNEYFYHINPQIYWHGNGKLTIDYITIEDEYHRSVRLDSSDVTNVYLSRLKNQLQLIDSKDPYGNILYHYAKDEPFQGQFSMFKKMEEYLYSKNKQMIAVTNIQNGGVKPGGYPPYSHYDYYLNEIHPRRIMIDAYPLYESSDPNGNYYNIKWNDVNASRFVQSRLNSQLLNYYKDLATKVKHNPEFSSTELLYVPQIFGEGEKNSSGTLTEWHNIMPPRSMIKCLQLMPLCYAADGIYSFLLAYYDYATFNNSFMIGPLSFTYGFEDLCPTSNSTAWQMIIEANKKINIYGPKIRQLQWGTADVIMTNGAQGVTISDYMLDQLQVIPQNDGSPYQGYVQCGYYTDMNQSPSFMVVNRRAVFSEPNIPTVVQLPIDNFFTDADSQTVSFLLNSDANSHFSQNVALYDSYSGELFTDDEQNINIRIGPGDGRLLEMVATLPSSVNSDVTLAHKAVIKGVIVISSGNHVVIENGTKTIIKKHSQIYVTNGASFSIGGNVIVEDSVRIVVSPNGNFCTNGARIKMGQDSIIEIEGGSCTIEEVSINEAPGAQWAGLRTTASSTIIINDSSLSGAKYHGFENSNLFVSNCRFDIPVNSYGLVINNRSSGCSTQIINSDPAKGFFGSSNLSSKGIILGSVENKVIIHNTNFQNLLTGIWKSSNISERDSIAYCNFVNCLEGIKAISSKYLPKIEYCSFNNNNYSGGIGIRLTAATPYINECDFSNLSKGIFTEYSIVPEIFYKNGMYNSNFYENYIGIESRGSNHRVETCYFNQNEAGIINHAKSNLNLSYVANNVLSNHISNIEFYDEQPYESTIQVFAGHNDFYHILNNQTGFVTNDFTFDPNYYDFEWTYEHSIDASKNWFQDFEVRINDHHYSDYVIVNAFDQTPNMPSPPPDDSRLYNAMSFESQGLYEQAMEIFKSILDSPYEYEKRYLPSAADGVYRLTYLIADSTWSSSSYFDIKAIQYAVDDPQLTELLKDYLAKSYIADKEYQNAINLIQLRLDNPLNEVDSLLAVLDLEIVLQLYNMEEDKAPITTKYLQYKYADVQTFNTRHDEHWEQLYDLLGKSEEANTNIPVKPVITSNYPNPFNPSTTIAYYIPVKSNVDMAIYNIKGQRVKDLINNEIPKGSHWIVWDGKDNNGRAVGSGLYLVRIGIGNKVDTHKVMMLK